MGTALQDAPRLDKYTHSDGSATASAPAKAILFGEHFVVHGTDAILCAIDRRMSITASRSRDVRIISDMGVLECDSAALDPADVEPVLRPLYHIAKKTAKKSSGVTLRVKSEIPPGAGLGSSSACCVAGAAAALMLRDAGAPPSRDAIMRLASGAERTVFPDASGADAAASMLGGIVTYNRGGGCERIMGSGGAGFGLVVSDSKVAHSTGEMVSRVSRFRECNRAEFDALRKKESGLVSSVATILARRRRAGDDAPTAPALGKLASRNQKYLKKIGISNKKMDEMIRAMDSVTYGSKITGAGGGGCIIGFAEAQKQKPEPSGLLSTVPALPAFVRGSRQLPSAEAAARSMSEAGYDSFAAGIDCEGLILFNGTARCNIS